GHAAGAGAPRAQPRRPHRDLHRRRPRRQPRRTGRGRRTRHRRARARRDRVGRGCLARRPATRSRCGAGGCHRRTRAARRTVHVARGPGVRRRVTLGPAALRATRLAPALAAAAARGGPVAIVTDGAITDLADVPQDLLQQARIAVLPRAPFFDAFIDSVAGPTRVSAGDTVRLRVSYGTAGGRAGERPGKGEGRKGTLVVNLSGRRLLSR